jgi:hypothetical protein
VSTTPYRENDSRAATEFAQHLGLAIALLEQFQQVPQRLNGADMNQVRELEHEATTIWTSLWEQLDQARTIVSGLGRDTTSYDAARLAAGDVWLGAAEAKVSPWERTAAGRRRTIDWRSAPVAPAEHAVAALRAAMPEVVVSEPPPADIELRSGYKRIANYGPVAIIGAVITYVIWHFAL